jgi:hypothetical protein
VTGGHGHVVPRPDGAKARCGGPALCSVCAKELAAQQPVNAATPGQASAGQEFAAWAEAQGIGRGELYGWATMADVFAAGRQAAIAAREPNAAPEVVRSEPVVIRFTGEITDEEMARFREEFAKAVASQPLHVAREPHAADGPLVVRFRDEHGQVLSETRISPDAERKIAIPLDAEHMQVRAEPQPAPGNGERPAVYARFLRASYPALPDHQVADAWRSADAREAAFWRGIEAKATPAECREPAPGADGTTPGRRAHRRWHQARWPDGGEAETEKEWEILSGRAKAAWEAAAGGPELAALREELNAANAGGRAAWAMADRLREALDEARAALGKLADDGNLEARDLLAALTLPPGDARPS